jgi:glutathione S-transferase
MSLSWLQAYPAAADALAVLADRLRSSSGHFFFGSKPSSVDALLFGHLAFYKHSPIAAPTLQQKVRSSMWFSHATQHCGGGFADRELPATYEGYDMNASCSAWSEQYLQQL